MIQMSGRLLLCLALLLAGTGSVCTCIGDCCSHQSDVKLDMAATHHSHSGMDDCGKGHHEKSCGDEGCDQKGDCDGCAFCGCSNLTAKTENATTIENQSKKILQPVDVYTHILVRVDEPFLHSQVAQLEGHTRDIPLEPALPVYLSNHSILR